MDELMPEIVETWGSTNPLFHVSDPRAFTPREVCSHHDFVSELPAAMLNVPLLYDRSIDIEVEAKAKEAAIQKLQKKYWLIF
jgi:UV DNA damage repair endonuclease